MEVSTLAIPAAGVERDPFHRCAHAALTTLCSGKLVTNERTLSFVIGTGPVGLSTAGHAPAGVVGVPGKPLS